MKVWHEARNDAKLRSLSDRQFRVWFNLLLFASEQPIRGSITYSSDELLAIEVANGDVELLNETVKRLETFHCVSSRFIPVSNGPNETPMKRVEFVSFEKRQQNGVSGNGKKSSDRVRKFRANKRLMASETNETRVKRDETRVKRDETLLKHPVSRARTPVEGELEEELNPPPLKGIPLVSDSPIRTRDELDVIAEAGRLLGSDPRTQHLAMELGRTHNLPEWIEVPGWKFLRAARRLLSPEVTEAKRGKWAYFLGIVRGLSEAEREEPAAKKETPTERKRREFKEGIERMKAKERKERERADG